MAQQHRRAMWNAAAVIRLRERCNPHLSRLVLIFSRRAERAAGCRASLLERADAAQSALDRPGRAGVLSVLAGLALELARERLRVTRQTRIALHLARAVGIFARDAGSAAHLPRQLLELAGAARGARGQA